MRYLRAQLAALFVLFLLLSAVVYYAGGPIETGSETPSSFWKVFCFCIITALTIGYGDVVPTTIVRQIDSMLIGAMRPRQVQHWRK
jgi:voltage-gated potassium channel